MTHSNDEALLRRVVGRETLVRGQHYARCGAVVSVQWGPDGDRVFGQVRGNAPRPYSTVALLDAAADGALRSFAGSCSCPVGVDCKHSVALALARPRLVTVPTWQQRLDSLDSLDEPAPEHERVRVGLQFDAAVSGGRLASVLIRPVLAGRNGGWVRTGISWSNLHLHSYAAYGRPQVDPQHIRLLRELHALDGSSAGAYWPGSSAAVDLVAFGSRRLWDILAEAQAAGLPLVQAGKAGVAVTLHRSPFTVRLDAARADEQLTLRATFDLGDAADVQVVATPGVPAPVVPAPVVPAPGEVLLLGDPAHGVAWRPSPAQLHIAPLAHDPDPLVRELLLGEPLQIPRADEDVFFTRYYPRLRRRLPVTSSAGDVELPQVQRPSLVATVDFRRAGQIGLDWRWRYRVGQAVREVPLDIAGRVGDTADDDRDRITEHALLAAAAALLEPVAAAVEMVPGADGRPAAAAVLSGIDAVRFVTGFLAALERADGVVVERVGDPADYREVSGETRIEFTDATDGADGADDRGSDWFDLAVRVRVGDDDLPFEPLFVALATDQTHLLLDDGRWLRLDRPELRELARVIAEARSVHEQPRRTVRVSRYQAELWNDLDAVGSLSGAAASWQQSVRALADVEQLAEVSVPAGLQAELRPYQLTGLRWLAFLFDHRLGGVLADDMGLGKTVQTLAAVLRAREQSPDAPPFLIVAPTTVMSNWQAESARFAPSLRTTVVTETFARRRVPLAEVARDADIVITSYMLFRLEHDAYCAQRWSGLVLDEAQAAKNHLSRNYACAKQLAAPVKLAITGTPMENHLGELWSLLSITAPGLFPTPARFEELYRRPIERGASDLAAGRLDSLRRRIRPVMLRRTKDQVAADLPDKQEQVLEVELHPRHRRAYDTLLHRERQKVLGLLDDLDGNRFEILRSLTVLRQAALDIALVDPSTQSVPATKLDVLSELLQGIAADGHRTLVFSQFTRFLRAARDRLELAGIESCYLDGSTRDRPTVIERFKTGTAPVFLISLKAGGVGLNLTEADYCVLLDPWWNPATEAQAIDRTHRIGQTRKVMVYRMVAKATIEEKVAALKDRKAALFKDVLGSGAFSGARLSVADIRAMLD